MICHCWREGKKKKHQVFVVFFGGDVCCNSTPNCPEALEGGPQSVPELTSKLKRTTTTPKSLAHLLKILQRQNSKVIYGSVGCDDDGRYHLTETGRQALTQRRKLLGSGRPRLRVRHEEVSQRDVSNNVAAEKPVGCGEP